MSDPCQYVITTLENHNSRLDKEAIILAQAEKGNDEFFEGARLALDPMITFGLKQIPEKKDEDGPGLAWDNFTLIITGFVNRSLTGNLARDTVANMMASATKKEWSIHEENKNTFLQALDLNAKERSRRFVVMNSKRSAAKVHDVVKLKTVSLLLEMKK